MKHNRLIRKLNSSNEEEKISKDRYLLTYADLITLLLGLFVILYAISKIDEDKYKNFSKAFSEYFKSTKEQVLQGSGGALHGYRNGIPEPIMPNPSPKSLDDVAHETMIKLKSFIDEGTLKININKDEIVVTLPEKLLFNSGKSEIEQKGMGALDSLAKALKGIPFQISVDGHTDDDPIRSNKPESNWHLSVMRAANVGYTLVKNGAPENNMVVRGYGAQRPVAENSTQEGKMLNRRVEIKVSKLPTDVPSTNGYSKQDSLAK